MPDFHFDSDYMQLAHPKILEKMLTLKDESFPGYGLDEICRSAKEKIRSACGLPDAEIHFLIGGTQTNVITIDAILQPYQGVLSALSGHIGVHEAGAVEATGHKVLTLPSCDGKVEADDVDRYLSTFNADPNREHMVQPGLLYITHPTELGTLYSLAELESLSMTCHRYGLPLYLDGARLGYGLAADGTDVTLRDIARLTDAFYIGGTKCGALMGEAVVFTRRGLVSHFFTQIKRHNSLLAKGWIIGTQFDVLFTDNLYLEACRQGDLMAYRLKDGFRRKGIGLFADSPTNQQFVVLTTEQAERLSHIATFEEWQKLPDERIVARFVTSWHTAKDEVDRFLEAI